MQIAFALLSMLAAFLLFFIQPMAGKLLTPVFGGASSVWTACLVTFQLLLLGGYCYAHLLNRHVPSRRQGWTHFLVLAAATLWLGVNKAASGHFLLPFWTASASNLSAPLGPILVLMGGAGPVFLALSATAPLLQAWYGRQGLGSMPYRLYALSNLGSFLGLLGYPLLAEPFLVMRRQELVLFIGTVLFLACLPFITARPTSASEPRPESTSPWEHGWVPWAIVGAAATGSALLVAVSSQMSSLFGAVPLIWILPLAAYLVTFIVCFEYTRFSQRPGLGLLLLALFSAGMVTLVFVEFTGRYKGLGVLFYTAIVFAGCSICHRFLYQIKPGTSNLTRFYLLLALGGSLGGLSTGILAPLLYDRLVEFSIVCLVVVCFGGLALWRREGGRLLVASCVLLGGVAAVVHESRILLKPGHSVRDPYGIYVVTVRSSGPSGGRLAYLANNHVTHGCMDMANVLRPLSYYGPQSGWGISMATARAKKPHLRIGIVGLGVGGAAAYARPGDTVVVYEISPKVIKLAGSRPTHFPILRECGAQVEVVLGDARHSLQHEASRAFDVILVDAFSGGEVPWHLLTREAFELYDRHLVPDGLIAINASNWLKLDWMIAAQARRMNWIALGIGHFPSAEQPSLPPGISPSLFTVLARNPGALPLVDPWASAAWIVSPWASPVPWFQERLRFGGHLADQIRPWTDEDNSIALLLKTTLLAELHESRPPEAIPPSR